MNTLYLSGPITSTAGNSLWALEQNVRVAEEVYLALLQTGVCAPLCPHTMSRFFVGEIGWNAFMKVDLELLERCDGLLLLPNWDLSSGAMQEVNHAKQMEQPFPLFAVGGPPAAGIGGINQLTRWLALEETAAKILHDRIITAMVRWRTYDEQRREVQMQTDR
jgi:hypothetical protein